MRGIILGVFLTIAMIVMGGYVFLRSGKYSMATAAPALPLEKAVAGMAIRASIGSAKDKKDPLPMDDRNMVAGAKVYENNCEGCHGAPQHSRPLIAKAMYPSPPQLFESDDMVTDDPEGETYWKVTNGIRMTGMPSFATILSDTERWQVTMLVAHADKLPGAARALLGQ